MANTAPLFFGAVHLAWQRLHADTGELQIGDSTGVGGPTATSFGWAWAKHFRPDRWAGFGGNYFGGGIWGVGYFTNRTWCTVSQPASRTGPNSLTGWTGWGSHGTGYSSGLIATYNGGVVDPDFNAYWTRVTEFDFNPANLPNPTVFDGQALTFNHLIYAHSQGPSSYQLRVRDGTVGTTKLGESLAQSAFAATGIDGPAFRTNTVTASAQTWSTLKCSLSIQSTPNQTTSSGETIVTVTANVRCGNGYRPMNFGIGGNWLDDFTDESAYSDACWTAIIACGDISIVRINLGINGSGIVSKATYKSGLRTFMNRLRAIKPGIGFILAASHETSNAGAISEYVDAQYELTQESPSDTLFLNIYRLCYGEETTPYTQVNPRLLSDGTHPTQTGYSYKAIVEELLTEQAAQEASRAMVIGARGVFIR